MSDLIRFIRDVSSHQLNVLRDDNKLATTPPAPDVATAMLNHSEDVREMVSYPVVRVVPDEMNPTTIRAVAAAWTQHQLSAKDSFTLWESICGDGSWQANPWVWVVEFKRVWGESMSFGRYIYHYCAVSNQGTFSGIAQLHSRITSQAHLEDMKKKIANECSFDAKAITSLSYLGREFEEPTDEMADAIHQAKYVPAIWQRLSGGINE